MPDEAAHQFEPLLTACPQCTVQIAVAPSKWQRQLKCDRCGTSFALLATPKEMFRKREAGESVNAADPTVLGGLLVVVGVVISAIALIALVYTTRQVVDASPAIARAANEATSITIRWVRYGTCITLVVAALASYANATREAAGGLVVLAVVVFLLPSYVILGMIVCIGLVIAGVAALHFGHSSSPWHAAPFSNGKNPLPHSASPFSHGTSPLPEATASSRDDSPAPESPLDSLEARRRKLFNSPWRNLRAIPFETFIKDSFECNSYDAKLTRQSGDFGVDLTVKIDGLNLAVQAKGYDGPVGPDAVKEVNAGKAHYDCPLSVVITNSSFTREAIDRARRLGVTLIAGAEFKNFIWNRVDFLDASIFGKRTKLSRRGWEQMDGGELRQFVRESLELNGYGVETPINTSGRDLKARRGTLTIVIHVFGFGESVGVKAVQSIQSDVDEAGCVGAIVTNSTFTEGARALAKSNGLTLISGPGVLDLVMDKTSFAKADR